MAQFIGFIDETSTSDTPDTFANVDIIDYIVKGELTVTIIFKDESCMTVINGISEVMDIIRSDSRIPLTRASR